MVLSGGRHRVHLEDEGITVDFEEAIRLNVAGVGLSVFVGTEFGDKPFSDSASLGIRHLEGRGSRYNGCRGELEIRTKGIWRFAAGSRELGAHIVKTFTVEQSLRENPKLGPFPRESGRSEVPRMFSTGSEAYIPGCRGSGHGKEHMAGDNPRIRAILGFAAGEHDAELGAHIVQDLKEESNPKNYIRNPSKMTREYATDTEMDVVLPTSRRRQGRCSDIPGL